MSQIADRYAQAFFELAKEQNSLEDVQVKMTDLRNLIINLEDFRLFIGNPLLSYEERCEVLKKLFEGKVPNLMFQFLLFVTYKSRLSMLKDIIESFDDLYLASTNHIRAYLATALPITDADKDLFNQKLKEKFHHNILSRWRVDPLLIGGFRIFLQGKMYDYSFKSQLNHFYQQSTQPV